MATKNIMPTSVFENQINGTVFAKEGSLNDPILGQQAGLFQSWKYGFDSGKQMFKANDGNKTYVKRLVKDVNGQPHWTSWMEMSTAETDGITAIAINDRPLQLPNEDGAIKLVITPEIVGTLSEEDIEAKIDDAIELANMSAYEYVDLTEYNTFDEYVASGKTSVKNEYYGYTTEQLLAVWANENPSVMADADQKFFVVYHNGSTKDEEKSTDFYIYADSTWMNVNVPDLSAYVTAVALSDKLSTLTAAYEAGDSTLSASITALSASLTAKITELSKSTAANLAAAITESNASLKEFMDATAVHTNDTTIHITSAERDKWNEAASDVTALPEGPNSYVASASGYREAYEQPVISSKSSQKSVLSYATDKHTFTNGQYLIDSGDGLAGYIKALREQDAIVTGVKINIASFTSSEVASFYLEDDNGNKSKTYYGSDSSLLWTINSTLDPSTVKFVITSTDGATNPYINVYTVDVDIIYYEATAVQFGDSTLPLNLIGKGELQVNGTEIAELESLNKQFANKDETETTLASHKASIDSLTESVNTIEATHSSDVDEIKGLIASNAEADDKRLTALETTTAQNTSDIATKAATEDVDKKFEEVSSEFEDVKTDIKTINSSISGLNDTATAISGEYEELKTSISDVDAKTETNKAAINENKAAIETANTNIAANKAAYETLVAVIDSNKTTAAEGDATLQSEINTLTAGLDNIKADAIALTKEGLETFDLVIYSDDSFAAAIEDGTFEKAARILVKSGTYHYEGKEAKALDFSNIKLIKGEYPAYLIASESGMPTPTNYENTKFEDVYLTIGYDTNALVIKPESDKVIEEEITGDTTITLNDLHSVYKLVVKADAAITLVGAIEGKDYVFFIDQADDAYTVKFTNVFTNGASELNTGLDNQKAGYRTVIRATATNDVADDCFILNEVVYGVINESTTVGVVKVIAGSTTCAIHNASYSEQAVNYADDEVIGSGLPGNSITFTPRILDGFAHATDGVDWTATVKETGAVVATGKCDETCTFTIPSSLKQLSDGTMPTIVVSFSVKAQMATIKLADGYSDYIKTSSGFTSVQAGYESAEIDFTMKDDFYVYRISDSLGNELQGSLPWTYTLPALSTHEDYEVTITPHFYAAFDSVDVEVETGKYTFDGTKVALTGKNDIAFDAAVSDTVKNDPNYGTLYMQAPISFVDNGDDFDVSTSYVNGGTNGKDQEGILTIPTSLAGKDIVLAFTWPGKTGTVEKQFTVSGVPTTASTIKIEGAEKVDGVYQLNTDALVKATFNASVDWDVENMISQNGSWRCSNSNGTLSSSDKDTCVVAANTKGAFNLIFTCELTGDEYSVPCMVVTHAATAEIPAIAAKTSSTYTPKVTFYSSNGEAIASSLLSDPSGEFSSESSRITGGTSITISNDKIPDGETSVTVDYTFTPSDTYEMGAGYSVSNTVTITRKQYVLQFTLTDTNITSITVSNVGYQYGGNSFTFSINYATGTKASDATKAALEAAFESVEIIRDVEGLFTATVVMPYADTTVVLA